MSRSEDNKVWDLSSMSIRVLLADDQALFRESLRNSLVAAGFVVVGEAGTGEQAVALAVQHKPDVVVMDISMRQLDGITACRRICRQSPDTKVVMLTRHHEDSMVAKAVQAGASGYLVKDTTLRDLTRAVQQAERGETVIAPQLRPAVLAAARDILQNGSTNGPATAVRVAEPTAVCRLTRRETEVLQLITDGRSTPEVADDLYISQKTVKNHLASVYQKLDARDRTQAVVSAMRLGLVTLN
jgi:DNA-binding NarL/FixJ family response regulator